MTDQPQFLPPDVYDNGNGYFIICQEWPQLDGDKYMRIMVAPDQAEALAHSLLAIARRDIPRK